MIIVLIIIPVHSQVMDVKLSWEVNDGRLEFPEAGYTENHKSLPLYRKIIPWPHDRKVPEVNIKVKDYSNIDDLYTNNIAHFNNATLKNTPHIEYQIVYEKKRPFLQITVIPLFNNENTGKTSIVNAFSIITEAVSPMTSLKALDNGNFINQSLLNSGNWFKIAVKTSGIHKLTYENLEEIGVENPAMVKIFGAGAVQLPEDYGKGFYDDLAEIPLYIEKGNDQLFGPGDYVLFYATGPVQWKYNIEQDFYTQHIHDYSTNGYYFITSDQGAASKPLSISNAEDAPDNIVDSYDILDFFEEENLNLLNSGREWYSEQYKLTLSGAYPFTLEGLQTNEPLNIKVSSAIRSNEVSSIEIKANNSLLGELTANPVNLSNYASTFAIAANGQFSHNPTSNIITVQVKYLQPNSNSEAWLNYITINGRARLKLTDDQLAFRDSRSVNFGSVSEFRVDNVSDNHVIWDITDPEKPREIQFNTANNNAVFKVQTDSLREFVAFNPAGNFPVPEINTSGLGKVPNQNLHGTPPPEMLIIYPDELFDPAERLANHRIENDNMDVLMVSQEMIYNEFSSGTPDVSAIRNYLKMYYDNSHPEEMVDYLLLFGDGSYDNRDTSSTNPNLIMTYQSENSLVPTASYVSDDFFGLLDTGEKLYDGLLDIGIGRLPVSTLDEAEALVDKIIAYDKPETLGEWRNYICLIGDDEDGNIHMRQANSLANYIEDEYPSYNVNRIFMDAYQQETTPTGDRYPDVTRAINDQMNRGALIINYTGHGGVTGLAHEKILDVNNIKSWNNEGKYPLFMTATCEFSRYDEYNTSTKSEITTAGEEVLLNQNGGSIALFTTTRLVYSGPNHVLNEKFYEVVFDKQENGESYRLGDIIAYSKNNAGAGINKRNFTLLGDPSLALAFPRNQIVTDSINNVHVDNSNDTISALEYVTLSGHVADRKGNLMDDFNGIVVPVVFDKKSNLKTLSNDGNRTMEFQSRNAIIYKGNVSAENGKFNFGFYVPKDISYNIGTGKISYYSYNESTDAHGSMTDIQIGGLGEFALLDTAGPDIRLFMNDTLFKNGGIVNSSPELLVYVEDQYGINTTGNGIGHDITATLNDDRVNAINLNGYYLADINSFAKGQIRYPYNNLPEGNHSIEVKVWDIYNNSAMESIDFVVVESTEMLLEKIYTYPNPFINKTWFNIEHNRPDEELQVDIRIYNMQGDMVYYFNDLIYSGGYRIDPPSWEGKSSSGATLSGGLYVYKVIVRSEEGEKTAGSGKLIIKR